MTNKETNNNSKRPYTRRGPKPSVEVTFGQNIKKEIVALKTLSKLTTAQRNRVIGFFN